MADENETTQEPAKKSGFLSLIVIAVISIVGGLATPMIASVITSAAATSAKDHAAADQHEPPMFLPLDDITVNLDSSTLTRFLRVKIALQLRESNQKEVEAALQANRQVLKDWLLGYLRDQKLEEIRGAAGHNRLRHDIRDQINAMLFRGKDEKIEQVLFEEFNVQ